MPAGDFLYGLMGTGLGNCIGPDVASVAGVMAAPTHAYHRWTGALAITGITVPTELAMGGFFFVIPTGAFTWTTATNIAVAGTAVVSRLLMWAWNPVTVKWYPSYV